MVVLHRQNTSAGFLWHSPITTSEGRHMKERFKRHGRLLAGALLVALAAVSLAGLAIASPATGKGAAASQYAYGPAGAAYGKNKIVICHKGKTLKIPVPALKGHQRHGDKTGACP